MATNQLKFSRWAAVGLALVCAVAGTSSLAGAQNYPIKGNTPGFIKKAQDLGAADPSAVISVTAWLALHNENKLDQLVQSQNQKNSPNYHKWISQGEFNASYGPTSQELKAVQNFLSAHNLRVIDIAENNMYVKVQGTIADVQKTFHVQIDNFSLNGQTYRANKSDPSVNGGGGHIAAVSGMDDFGFQPSVVRPAGPD